MMIAGISNSIKPANQQGHSLVAVEGAPCPINGDIHEKSEKSGAYPRIDHEIYASHGKTGKDLTPCQRRPEQRKYKHRKGRPEHGKNVGAAKDTHHL